MPYSQNLKNSFYVFAVSATLLLASGTQAASLEQQTAASLATAIEQGIQRPKTLARALLNGPQAFEAMDSLRFAPRIESGVHHVDGVGVPLRNTVGLDATTMTLELNQPLYRNGQSRAQAQVTDSHMRAEQAERKLQLQAASLSIINVYLDAQRDAEQLDLMHRLNYSAQEIAKKGADLAFIRQELFDLSGIRPDAVLAPVDQPLRLPRSLQAALINTETQHPALAKAIYECAAAEASSRWVNWAQEPNIDLRGALDRTVDTFEDRAQEDSGTIGLRATIPFSDDTTQKSRLVQARESAETTRQNIEATRLKLRQSVTAAWDAMATAAENISIQQHKARLAEAGANRTLPADSALKGDRATFTRLAQQAKLAEIDARYQLRKAEFALLAATGQLGEGLHVLPESRELRKEASTTNMGNKIAAQAAQNARGELLSTTSLP